MPSIQPFIPYQAPTHRVPQARPPGALPEFDFEDACTRCGDCVAVCPALALRRADDGMPLMRREDACTQCGLCVDICMPSALRHTVETRAGLDAVLRSERGH